MHNLNQPIRRLPRPPPLPQVWLVESFLRQFDHVRNLCDRAEFTGQVNSADGVLYPHINTAVPEQFRAEITERLSEVVGRPVAVHTLFMRLSPEGVQAPHQAHTDTIMGQYSAMIYLNHRFHCEGGTALLQHATGARTEEALGGELWARDTNRYEMWDEIEFCPMRPNRAFVFDSRYFHRAEPVEGFGRDARNGRLVMTAFFSEAKA